MLSFPQYRDFDETENFEEGRFERAHLSVRVFGCLLPRGYFLYLLFLVGEKRRARANDSNADSDTHVAPTFSLVLYFHT